jgi:hypothetical protein
MKPDKPAVAVSSATVRPAIQKSYAKKQRAQAGRKKLKG